MNKIKISLIVALLYCFFCCLSIKIDNIDQGERSGVKIRNFTPKSREENRIKNCLNGKNLRPNGRRRRRRLLKSCNEIHSIVNEMSNQTTRNRFERLCRDFPDEGDSDLLFQEYSRKIVEMRRSWREFDGDGVQLTDLMLDMVAPCSKFIPSIHKRWKNFFSTQIHIQRPEGFSIKPKSQRWVGQELLVTFGRPNFKWTYIASNTVAVDLVLNRASPCQLGEKYGIYTFFVIRNDLDSVVKDILHRSKQASCPTLEGYMNVLRLDTTSMVRWFFRETKDIELKIRMRSIRQLFLDNNNERKLVPVLRRAVSLFFSFKKRENADEDRGWLINQLIPSETGRNRRSIRLVPNNQGRHQGAGLAACERLSFTANFQQPWMNSLGIVYPLELDVGVCSGRCQFLQRDALNDTNHETAMSLVNQYNKLSHPFYTTGCRPIGYEDLDYLSFGQNDTLAVGCMKNQIISRCGCV